MGEPAFDDCIIVHPQASSTQSANPVGNVDCSNKSQISCSTSSYTSSMVSNVQYTYISSLVYQIFFHEV